VKNLSEVKKNSTYKNIQRCPECGGKNIIIDHTRGDTICADCGLVINDDLLIDEGPEWRSFTSEEERERSRVGSPTTYLLPDKGLSTSIGKTNRDIFGQPFQPKNRAQIYRLRKLQIRTIVYDSVAKNLSKALPEISRVASQLGISRNVQKTAAMIYRKAVKKGLVRGRKIETMATAAIYLACRLHRIPRSLDDFEEVALDKNLRYCVRIMLRNLNLQFPRAKAKDFIPGLANQLDMSIEAQKKAIEIIEAIEELGIGGGKSPIGLAAAALYIASILTGLRRTQKEIAKAANITEVTIRNRYQEIIRKLKIKIDPDVLRNRYHSSLGRSRR